MAPSTFVVRPKPPTAATRRRLRLRAELFPDTNDEELWHRASFKGFTSVPRTLSIIMTIIDSLDAKSAGRVYFDLWCRSFDDYFIDVKDEYDFSHSSGYSGQRAIRSWRERLLVLSKFGFIKAMRATHGSYRYILLLDPHPIIERLSEEGLVSEEDKLMLDSFMMTIGAK